MTPPSDMPQNPDDLPANVLLVGEVKTGDGCPLTVLGSAVEGLLFLRAAVMEEHGLTRQKAEEALIKTGFFRADDSISGQLRI
jgi:hypothetical protein